MPYTNSGGKQCFIFGCNNNQKKLYNWEKSLCEIHVGQKHGDCPCLHLFKMHYIPKNDVMKRAWMKAINRKEFNPTTQSVVCSIRFVDGRPTKTNPIPSLHMGYDNNKQPSRRPLVRRSLMLNTPTQHEPKVTRPTPTNERPIPTEEMLTATPLQILENIENAESNSSHGLAECDAVCCFMYSNLCQNYVKPKMVDMGTQTLDPCKLDHTYSYMYQTKSASTQCSAPEFSVDSIVNDNDSKFYTGLSLAVFLTFITTVTKFGKDLPYRLSIPNQILLVLVRLRLALTFNDLGRRFGISHQLASSIFNRWIDILVEHLSLFVSWLPRETIRRTTPSSFRNYPITTCIIDCSVIFIQRPFTLKAKAQTWSTYKTHTTAKFLIAIAPSGFIMFISPLYGGRASDNYITKNSGFLNFLLPGDEVMADRGFTIGEELCARRVKLNIPAFMKSRAQLSEEETIQSRRIAAERIHVERAINRFKSFKLVNTTLGIKTLKRGDETIKVIGALCNMRDSLIRDDVDLEDYI